MSSMMARVVATLLRPEISLALLTIGAAGAGYVGYTSRGGRPVDIGTVKTTVGDIRSLHAEVRVAGREVRGDARLRDGDEVTTAPGGRARMRLDDGTVVIVDGNAALTLRGSRLTLAKGRVFVQALAASRTEVAVKDTVTTVVSSAAAFDEGAAKVYCARGELVVGSSGKSVHVHSGETASVGGDTRVAPETAFDDWTGGLAVPWSGERAPASAIAELWGGGGDADPGAPLVVRSAKVDVTVEGEVTLTRVRTTYFNGSDRNVDADVRMALPEGAVVSRVTRQDEGASYEQPAYLGVGSRSPEKPSQSRLEWAGSGWLRGTLTGIQAGASVDLIVEYGEWLSEKDGHATYRFPMASDSDAPMVGGLSVHVGSQAPAQWLSASTGAAALAGSIELRRADVRPSGDLVVEMVPSVIHPGAARAYVDRTDSHEDPYVLVRTEVPELGDDASGGVSLALVVDSSSSIGPALLETERSAVDAVLESLGPKDSVIVLAADQDTQVVGPPQPTSVTPELRASVRADLAKVRPGGASNLGLALERAADLLDARGQGSGANMVVYLGDGRPTVGESDARELRKRLSRRAGGVPRLGALAIGQGADRWMLGELVAGAGPVYDVLDRPDAARASSALVAEALAPTIRDVALDLGPTVDRVYPRDARTVVAGSTVTVVGRLRGELPSQVGLRYRRGDKVVEERRVLSVVPRPEFADVARRWAQQRIEENVTHADGIEPSIALASSARLLTPWTSWFWGGATASAPWDDRLLGLSASVDTAFADKVAPAPPPPSILLEPSADDGGDEASIEQAAEIAARHSIQESLASMIACRDARASIKPGVSGNLRVDLAIAAGGKATKVVVSAANAGDDDPILDRCIRVVVSAVPFFASGVAISFTQTITLPPGQTSRRTQCSVASTLPLAVRRGIWRARKAKGTLDYAGAAHSCELPTWSDRRAILGILVGGLNAQSGTALAARLSESGETDAAAFVRQELLRNVSLSSLGYSELRRLLIDDEPKIDRVLDKAYRDAKTDDARLAVLRRFLRLAPHSPLGRRLLLAVLEAKNDRPALLDAIEQIRYDVFADAGLLSECASALRRLGMDKEGRRAFGELVERAPRDPWTLGYVGDRLRAEGLYEDALAAYLRLDAAMPDDPAVALRLALAHAGAGRLDVATRLLDRVAQTGGRGDDGRLGELASVVSASLIAAARQGQAGNAETDALLVRRLAQTPLPDVASVILVRTPLTDEKVEVLVARQDKDKDELPADLDASAMGLSAVRIERGGGVARIRLRRTAGLSNGRPTRGIVTALVLGGDRSQSRLVTREVDIAPGDKGTELRWNGEAFQ
jgi:hypothetical protein